MGKIKVVTRDDMIAARQKVVYKTASRCMDCYPNREESDRRIRLAYEGFVRRSSDDPNYTLFANEVAAVVKGTCREWFRSPVAQPPARQNAVFQFARLN